MFLFKNKEWKKYKKLGTLEKFKIPETPNKLLKKIHIINKKINESSKFDEKIRYVYYLMDIMSKHIKTFAVCDKHCSASCCCINIDISIKEANYIELNTGIKVWQNKIYQNSDDRSCPFLTSNNKCSIYQYRPFICRSYWVLDYKCSNNIDERHYNYGSQEGGYGNAIYKEIAKMLMKFSNYQMDDIRNYFPRKKENIKN
jgi:Fe-S-cluster containining protein